MKEFWQIVFVKYSKLTISIMLLILLMEVIVWGTK
jgi:hypothetical protein